MLSHRMIYQTLLRSCFASLVQQAFVDPMLYEPVCRKAISVHLDGEAAKLATLLVGSTGAL